MLGHIRGTILIR